MQRGLLCVVLASGGCVSMPDGDHEVGDSDDADLDEMIDDARKTKTARDDETPLEAYLRERQEYYDRVDGEPPSGADGRRELRRIARSCREGEAAAASELEQGYFGVATFGLPADCYDRFARAAWDRYSVAHHWMGCVIDDTNGPFAGCYNHVMRREIAKAHGPTALDELREQMCTRPPPPAD